MIEKMIEKMIEFIIKLFRKFFPKQRYVHRLCPEMWMYNTKNEILKIHFDKFIGFENNGGWIDIDYRVDGCVKCEGYVNTMKELFAWMKIHNFK